MSYQDSIASIRPGTLFCERYRIERVLDEGGMATIYLAIDESSGLPVAIKVLFYHYCDNEVVRVRFLDEGRIQAMLNHPNIVHVYRVISEPVLSFVMEYVDGGTLEDHLREQGRLSEVEVVDLILPVMSAVGFAHSKGIVHRDLKPSNVLVKNSAGYLEPKVMDFGVAKIPKGKQLTTVGTTVGTLHYMSPEQIVGASNIDGRADIYSLGCTLYKLCTGEVPFNAGSEFALMMAQVEAPPKPPRELRSDLSVGMEKVILKALAKEPERRFQTIKEMTKALMNLGAPGNRSADTDTHTRPIPEELLRFAMEADEVALDQTSQYRQEHLAAGAAGLATGDLARKVAREMGRLDDNRTHELSFSAVHEIKGDRFLAAQRQSNRGLEPIGRQEEGLGADDATRETRLEEIATTPRKSAEIGRKEELRPTREMDRSRPGRKDPGDGTTQERVSPGKLARMGITVGRADVDSQEITNMMIDQAKLDAAARAQMGLVDDVEVRSKESLLGFDGHEKPEDITAVERPSGRGLPELEEEEKTAEQRPSALKAGYEAQERKRRELSIRGGEDQEDATVDARPSGLNQALKRQEPSGRSSGVAQEIDLKRVQESQERDRPIFARQPAASGEVGGLEGAKVTEVSGEEIPGKIWILAGGGALVVAVLMLILVLLFAR